MDNSDNLGQGQRIGNYKIESVISRGGQATVYKCRHLMLERVDAVKVMPGLVTNNDRAFADFRQEGKIAARLLHPNIVTVHDAGETDGVFYIAMSYVEGPNLYTFCTSLDRNHGQRLTEAATRRAIRLFHQVAVALDAAHGERLVHRDVKPANILVAHAGDEEERVVLVDFGISKLLDESQSAVNLTDGFRGTLPYAAPERLIGETGDGRCDQYSFACCVYHCLVGEPPFPRRRQEEIRQAHLNTLPPSASERSGALPPAVDAVFSRALAKGPNERFPTCEDFVADLERAMSAPTEPTVTVGQVPTDDGRRRTAEEPSGLSAPSRVRRTGLLRRVSLVGALVVLPILVVVSYVFAPFLPRPFGLPDPANAGTATPTMNDDGRLVHVFSGHTGIVWSVAFSPHGELVASGGDDGMVRLWNPVTRGPVGQPLAGHADAVRSVAFSPDGELLASGSEDGTVRLWDPSAGRPVGRSLLVGHDGWVNSVAFSPDGRLLASGGADQTVRLWDPATGQPVGRPLTGHGGAVRSVAFSPDGKLIASAGADQTVRLWEPTSRQTILSFRSPLGSVTSLAFSPDGKLVACAIEDGTVRLWSTTTGQQVGGQMTGHSSGVISVAFSPDGKLLASGGDDGSVRLWDAATGKQVGRPLSGHTSGAKDVAFASDGTLASGGGDHLVKLWSPTG
jgi:eukaryotic-like serine/threonine-protein kinase